MKKIRVCHVVCGLLSGGVEQMIVNYSTYMDKEKFQFDVIFQHEPDKACLKKFKDLGFGTYQIPAKAKNPVGNAVQTFQILRKNKYHIVHTHMTLMNFIPLFCAGVCGIPVRISHSHNVDDRKKNIFKRSFEAVCRTLTQLSATELVACGKDAGAYLYGEKGAKVFNNAVNMSDFRYNGKIRGETRRLLKLDQKQVIGHIGRFTEQKNHAFLIDIFKVIHMKNPDSVLMLIGAGELELDIHTKVNKLGLNDAVLFIGTKKEVSPFLQAMDVFLLPSLWEGFPVTLIEAQAVGLPCVVANTISSAVKIIDDLEFISLNASVDEWADKVLLKASSEGDREQFAEQVAKAGYDIIEMAQELQNFYLISLRRT